MNQGFFFSPRLFFSKWPVEAMEILEKNEELKSDTVLEAISQIKKQLISSLEATNYDYHFYVVKNESVNAFATLGGHIFIFSGLIDMTDEPEELAAVLAHEIGHVEKRHVVNKLVRK